MKEIKRHVRVNRDPELSVSKTDFRFRNRLALPEKLKKYLADKGLDYRFLNATVFRNNGNYHDRYWVPFKFEPSENPADYDIHGVNAEGMISRQDLILGVRPKATTAEYRAYLKDRINAHKGVNRRNAEELRQMAREAGLSKHVKVTEGYEDN